MMWESLGTVKDGYRLTIRATRVSMRQLVAIIVGCVAVGGVAAAAIMIAFSTGTGITLGTSAIVAVAGGLGIVLVLALLRVFVWRRKRYTVDWSDAGLRIRSVGPELILPWASIARILVRTDTDYARVEIRRTDNTSVSLLAGFGSQDVKKANAIDHIPAGVAELLRRQQFVERPSCKRNALGLHIFIPRQPSLPR
ncbi:hypothetical protein ASE14_11975 [Agromyces sp. Root81]|uniref:hypothetical protein n=1 Tax=Agromyces sp. Root81 TaxID=1736601 RepID=UPI0006F89F4B|nr:hypothetical protein [Agromyces sp. Root81]KRC61558.1 hypothetical protein ASE14_11975 [Agromyces sp. Root81]